MDSMANTSGRMLRLLSLLQTHRYWPGAELAERLGVSERTLRRDIDRLRELGYPVDAGRGVGGGYQLRSGAAMPPLQLDDEEAVAIAVGLRSAAAGAVGGDGDGVAEISVRALAKIVQVMPPRLRRRVEALQDITVPAMGRMPRLDAAALAVLAQCCRDGERVRFSYTARDGASTDRTVEPHRLVAQDRRWYLVAYDLERQDWRTFRVDRLSRPEPTGARFRHREIPAGTPPRSSVPRPPPVRSATRWWWTCGRRPTRSARSSAAGAPSRRPAPTPAAGRSASTASSGPSWSWPSRTPTSPSTPHRN